MKQPSLLNNWGLYFLFRDGYGGRDKIMQDFYKFYFNPELSNAFRPEGGICYIGGHMRDEKRKKSDDFVKNQLDSIEFVGFGADYHGSFYGPIYEDKTKMFLARTTDGETYSLTTRSMSSMVFDMFIDLKKYNRLSHERYYYLPSELHYSSLFF
jgi:hypothetical protein